MKNRLTVLMLFVSLCGLWGCAKSNQPAVASARRAVNHSDEPQSDEPLSALNLPIVERKPGALPELQLWTPTPAPGSETAEKSKPNEAAVPLSVSATNQTAEGKPAEMKVVNALERLSSRVKTLLPGRSTSSDTATGFKNEKQFIAATHLSQNLNIPFDQIKTRVAGEHHMSMQDALRDLRPEMTKGEIKAEVNTAEKQAKEDESHAKEEAKKAAGREKLASNQK